MCLIEACHRALTQAPARVVAASLPRAFFLANVLAITLYFTLDVRAAIPANPL